MEVKRLRGPKVERQVAEPPPWAREEWVDDGPIRTVAELASERAQQEPPEDEAPRRVRKPAELDPDVVSEVEREAGGARSARYRERLTSAAEALARGRFDDAKRMVQPVLRDLPNVAMAHEIVGLSLYSTGQWRKAAAELELARQLDHSVRHHPVLADCYRALRRYDAVEALWNDLKSESPAPSVMAEGRIVMAGALADQGDLAGALKLLDRAAEVPKKVRDHHLRQWYVIGDLHDRSGDIVAARRFFALVAQHDSDFADVMQRLSGLGR